MSKLLSYADALKMFGADESKLLTFLDRLAGGVLLSAAVAGVPGSLSLFDAKTEAARLGYDLRNLVLGKLAKKGRSARSETITSAHAVIVIIAYFGVMEEVDLPLALADLDLSREEQLSLAALNLSPNEQTGKDQLEQLTTAIVEQNLARQMADATSLLPQPHRPFEAVQKDLLAYYQGLSRRLLQFMPGLAVWERLDETRRDELTSNLDEDLPRYAVQRYAELYNQLAVDVPEFAYWASLTDHKATRAKIDDVTERIGELERLFKGMTFDVKPGQRQTLLAKAYLAALDHPIAISGRVPGKLHLPRLGEAYIEPCFRLADVPPHADPSADSWWENVPVRGDLWRYLVGYLTSPAATRAPLVILGQPGAGKSVLTKMLAAQPPTVGFMPVRVPLAGSPADGTIQDQIEYAVREVTGKHIDWGDLVEELDGTVPVIMLDGFDELLQATGVNRSDYLKRVAEFQQREADLGRPVAVLVTSRMAVADRAAFPDGSMALRLEPFTDDQIDRWLRTWNKENDAYFKENELKPLTTKVALTYRHLAEQPLLLLMLALYDADGGGLQKTEAELGTAKLYERLLERFAHREVEKLTPGISGDQLDGAVRRELLALSVMAFAMFNRRRQWVTTRELDEDLSALLNDTPVSTTDFRAPLSQAEVTIGRFFFVHSTKATRDKKRVHTYEFLHATFGEYLIAQLVSDELSGLAEQYAVAERHTRQPLPADDFLNAILSFSIVAARRPIVDFLIERTGFIDDGSRGRLFYLLASWFRDSLNMRVQSGTLGYEPTRITATERHACYSANLLLLLTVIKGEAFTLSELLNNTPPGQHTWTKYSQLWKSQLSESEWENLVTTIRVSRVRGHETSRDLRFLLDANEPTSFLDSAGLGWHYDRPDRPMSDLAISYDTEAALLLREAAFLTDRNHDALLNALSPYFRHVDKRLLPWAATDPNEPISQAATSLIQLRLAEAGPNRVEDYNRALLRPDDGFPKARAAIVLRQLREDCAEIPVEDVLQLLGEIRRADVDDLVTYLDILECVAERGASVPSIIFYLDDAALLANQESFDELVSKRPNLAALHKG